jgi:hypothetical protein
MSTGRSLFSTSCSKVASVTSRIFATSFLLPLARDSIEAAAFIRITWDEHEHWSVPRPRKSCRTGARSLCVEPEYEHTDGRGDRGRRLAARVGECLDDHHALSLDQAPRLVQSHDSELGGRRRTGENCHCDRYEPCDWDA